MALIAKVPGADNLHVGGVWPLSMGRPWRLYELNITHVLSVLNYSLAPLGEEAKRFKHMSIDIDDDEQSDLLVSFPSAVRFIDSGLYPSPDGSGVAESLQDTSSSPEETPRSSSKGGVYVHCAMGKSRSVSCVIAYLLYKYPHRFGGKGSSRPTALQRRDTTSEAVQSALRSVRETRTFAEPNDGFMRQLELWWEIGCPADDDGAVERHPVYQKWLYSRMLEDARGMRMAPEAESIRFEDEVETDVGKVEAVEVQNDDRRPTDGQEVRCKKCRRILATPKFVVSHTPTGQAANPRCAHIFIDTLSWMRPALEGGALDGRLVCPNTKCGATVGRFAWQGLECSCREWVVPAFSLNRSRVDEVTPRRADPKVPPGRQGSL